MIQMAPEFKWQYDQFSRIYYFCLLIYIFLCMRILDILYSAQHGNQHKDAFA